MKKILIIRFSSIGDIVLTTPVVRCAKMQSDAEIHYLTKEQFLPVLESNPYITKIHTLKKEESIFALVGLLRKENFDFVVDLHNNLRTKLIKLFLQKPSKAFPKLNFQKWLLVNFKINRMPNIHIVDRYFEACKPLNIHNDHYGLDYFVPEKDQVEPDWLPEPFRKEYMIVSIGGQHFTKRMPLNKIIQLCDSINKPIILLGGKEDVAAATEIESFFKKRYTDIELGLEKLNKKTIIFNGCGKFNINQSAHLVSQSTLVFSHDTGLMHIAAAFKKKIYSIWGNTVPEFGMYPYKTPFVIWENKPLACRPCSKIGHQKCPKGHFKCMEDIKFEF